jgi:hypothetical protein
VNVLVDTSAWSPALKRSRPSSRGDAQVVEEHTELMQKSARSTDRRECGGSKSIFSFVQLLYEARARRARSDA